MEGRVAGRSARRVRHLQVWPAMADSGRPLQLVPLSCGGNAVYITHGRDQKDNYIGTGYTHLDKIFVQKVSGKAVEMF